MKYLFIIIGCLCTTVVAAESTVLITLWNRGMISAHHLQEIKLVLTNRTLADEPENETELKQQYPSVREVAEARAIKVLGFDKRESELMTLKGMADVKREALESQQKQFLAQRKEFEEELARIESEITAASTEQARGVLLALPPKDAVRQLMQIPLDQDVVLMKGMPEKTIAKILKEFQTAGDPAAGDGKDAPAERGRQIFEALSRGEPARTLLEAQRKAANTEPVN
jgi:flagellar motility protein MotE (MotC chaperone)